MTEGYRALRTSAAWLDLSERGKIVVTGRDRVRLLHNITTQHIKELNPGDGRYAFFLNVQGRIQADVNLLCFEDRFLLDTEPEARERVFAHIKRYIIADDVKLEDVTGSQATLGVEGPKAAEALAALGAPLPHVAFAHLSWDQAIIQNAASTGPSGFRLYLESARRSEWIARLESAGIPFATSDDAHVVRVEHGIPRLGEDIFDTTLVQETGRMHAVHFAKGCYLGQEIVERVRSRGHVNKMLVELEATGTEALPTGTKLSVNGAEVGDITSSVYSPGEGKVCALAYVRTAHAEPGSVLDTGSGRITIRKA